MHRRRPRRRKIGIGEPYYDLNDDWSLIVSSFQTQYGIRLSTDLKSMSWKEFSYLLQGLSDKTPLGGIVAIRAENDPETIKQFTAEQRRIRNEYRAKQAQHKTAKQTDTMLDDLKKAFVSLAK